MSRYVFPKDREQVHSLNYPWHVLKIRTIIINAIIQSTDLNISLIMSSLKEIALL